MGKGVVQSIRKETELDEFQVALKYYSILSILNSLGLTQRELELLAFTAVRGTITPLPAREEFVQKFHSSLDSLENIKGKLVKKGLMVKVEDMYRVNPHIALDFTGPVLLKILMRKDG